MKFIVFAIAVLFTTSAFAGPKSGTVVVDTTKILETPNLTNEQKSNLLTTQAEWLLTPDSIFLPYDIFKKALELDPANIKAQVYGAAIAPYMNYKGIFSKIEKLATVSAESKKAFEELKDTYKNNPMLLSFLSEPAPAFQSEKEFQVLLEKAFGELLSLRDKLRDLKGKKLPLFNVSSTLHGSGPNSAGDFPTDPNDSLKNCKYKIEDGKYTLQTCPVMDRSVVRADQADLDLLELEANTGLVALIMADSYDLSGIVEHYLLSRDREELRDVLTNEQKHKAKVEAMEKLLKHEDFGKLLSKQKIHTLSQLGGDVMTSLRTFAKYEKTFCPNSFSGFDRLNSARANNVFTSYCLGDQTKEMSVKDNLPGINSVIESGRGFFQLFARSAPHKTDFYFSRSYDQPVDDIKTLGLKVGKCGQLVFAKDPTVGGIFPYGDVNTISAGFAKCDQEQ